MVKAVFDTNVLVSAFLTRHHPGGVSSELLRFVINGAIDLYLSTEIVDEVVATLSEERFQKRYPSSSQQVGQYRADLLMLANTVDDPPPISGAVPRDPDDDKIIACAVAADVDYLVSRDHDLLSLGAYAGITMIAPEDFLRLLRQEPRA